MKPENMKCFEEVQRVIGYEPARIELQKVIDKYIVGDEGEEYCINLHTLLKAFDWEWTPQGYYFWREINEGRCPEEYTTPKDLDDMLQVGMTLEPNVLEGEVFTGFGVIIKCEENTFEVLTDFGNRITLTKSELLKNYKFGARGIVDVKERLEVQIKLLSEELSKLEEMT